MELGLRVCVGVVVATAVAMAAHRARSLSASGVAVAAIMGTAAVAAGFAWAVLLIAYFVSSSLLSRAGRSRKLARTAGVIEKHGPRDGWQVLANGAPFVVASCAAVLDSSRVDLWMAVGAGSLAASAADTWATEIGTLVGQVPRSILTWQPLAVGLSGGVTAAGSAASVAGAALLGLLTLAVGWPAGLVAPVIAGGLAGSLADSVIGASMQVRRWCDACQQPTEMSIHDCGAPSRQAGGIGAFQNDAVNFLATCIGGVVAAACLVATR